MASLVSPLEIESRYVRYNHSKAGKERRSKYRKESGKFVTSAKYLSKPFIGIDGESVTLPDNSQRYTCLTLSTGEVLREDNGLSSLDILTFLHRNLPESKNGLNVIFGGGYDFNFWVRDLPEDKLRALYESTYRDKPVSVGTYEVRWAKGKEFSIKVFGGKLVRISDVSSFFQTTFPEALEEWLGPDFEGLAKLKERKANREWFTLSDMPTLLEYSRHSVNALVVLCDALRLRLDQTNLRPRRWTGPGNSVATLFRRYGIKEHMDKAIPAPVASASRFAYAGGRIEVCRFGSVDNRPSYQYDMNSAYPEAIAKLPSLAGGTWQYYEGDPGPHEFALYKVSTHARNAYHPTPMFTRGPLGSISYPIHAYNWVWSPEMEAVREWSSRRMGKHNVVEAWVFTPATIVKPFAWVSELYAERARLKALGDPAQLAVKTIMQSVYGKLCQQLGYLGAEGRRREEIPPYHQLEWAGYVTSFTRAKMFRAALADPSSVIAFETDALFMSNRLEGLTIGTGLGEWKETAYTALTYVQSGIYSGTTVDGEKVLKVRGFNPGDITHESLTEALKKPEGFRQVTAQETSFIGIGIALQFPDLFAWCQWVTRDKVLRCEPVGKRIHALCGCGAAQQRGLVLGYWHGTMCPVSEQVSREYPVQWINPDPEMERLEKLRREINEWD